MNEIEQDEPEPLAQRHISGSIVFTELEMAVNRTPERRAALIEAKLSNARSTILAVWQQMDPL